MNTFHLTDPDQLIRDGQSHLAAGRHEAAEASFTEALRLRPNGEKPLLGLASAQFGRGDYPAAIRSFGTLIGLAPMNAQYHYNEGYCRLLNREYDAAEIILRNVLGVLQDPQVIASHALALYHSGKAEPQQALDQLLHAATRLPPESDIHATLAHLLLANGDYVRGFRLLERRRSLQNMVPRYEVPLWRGESLQGTNLLLWSEPGLADALQCARFVPMLADRARAEGGALTLLADARLAALWRESFAGLAPVVRIIEPGTTVPPYHLHCPLLSLPERLRVTPETVPVVPWLRAPEVRVAAWRDRLQAVPGLKVGIASRGDPDGNGPVPERYRSVPDAALAPLFALPGITWIGLQEGLAPAGGSVLDWPDARASLVETTALAATLDLLICADASACHLAGGLGTPVRLLAPFETDWRWLRGRDDSPWHSGLRIYRQTRPGDWGDPVARLQQDLVREAAARA